MLDMGEPVRIVDVAEQLIEQSGAPVEIEYTGLRPGEKLHEELFADEEPREKRGHPLVVHVPVPIVSDEQVAALPSSGEPERLRQAMRDLCATPAVAPAAFGRSAAT